MSKYLVLLTLSMVCMASLGSNISASEIPLPLQAKAMPTNTPTIGQQSVEEMILFPEELPDYDVELPTDMRTDLTNAIWFALTHGSAAVLDESDFYHCHVLLDHSVYDVKYTSDVFNGTLSEYINDQLKEYDGLLCHTQELNSHGLNPRNRNVIVWKDSDPYIMAPYEVNKGISPNDLHKVGSIQIDFHLSAIAEITLPDNTTINVVVRSPHIYLMGFYPSQIVVDLPE